MRTHRCTAGAFFAAEQPLRHTNQLCKQHTLPPTPWPAHKQVYNGTHAWWLEADAPDPVNAYGRSKLEAEQLLQEQWAGRFVALRSSLIYGPEPPLAPVGRPLFLQFVRQVLETGKDTTFFVDEFRCVGIGVCCCVSVAPNSICLRHPVCVCVVLLCRAVCAVTLHCHTGVQFMCRTYVRLFPTSLTGYSSSSSRRAVKQQGRHRTAAAARPRAPWLTCHTAYTTW